MILNEPMIDYLTLTTFDGELATKWQKEHFLKVEVEEKKVMQYQGAMIYKNGGSWFLGVGEQKGEPHYMLQVSGGAGSVAFDLYKTYILDGTAKPTRIDLQLTIDKPIGWSQSDLIIKCEQKGLKPRVERSSGEYGELITVYTGTRASGRMNRTYEKESKDGDRYMRFETEFGRGYSLPVAHSLAVGDASIQDFINGEVRRRKDVDMFQFFSVGEGVELPKAKKVKATSKTERWLLNVVLPCIVKYRNSHDSDPKIIRMIEKACKEENYE